MKICWDNIEGLRLTKTGRFRRSICSYNYYESCKECGEPYLGRVNSSYCCISCSQKGKNHPLYNKNHTKETKKKMSKAARRGRRHPNWSGGYWEKGIPLYDTYAPQINWCEKVRRNPIDKNVLQVRCSYNECGKWFTPTLENIKNRANVVNGRKNFRGYHRFYCSGECKKKCVMYGKKATQLMKMDAIKTGYDPWWELSREVQPELRKMVFERDDYQCIKCKSFEHLICHHKEGIVWAPLESADVDECITVYKECHGEIHQIEGCKPSDMRCD